MIQIQLQMFVLIVAGFFFGKKGVIDKNTRKHITDLAVYILLPCNIFHAFCSDVSADVIKNSLTVLIISAGVQAAYLLINTFAWNMFPKAQKAVVKYATICNNAGFLGLPVLEAVFGAEGLLYGAVSLIPLRLVMWTAGLSLFTKTDARQTVRRFAAHPCIWAVILGAAYMLSGITLPGFLLAAINSLSACVTGVTMLVIGAILSEVDLKSLVTLKTLYYSFVRLLAIPAIVFAVLTLIKTEKLCLGVSVLEAAMPAAAIVAMLAEKYDCDSQYASKILFVSTALSMITLPMWAYLVNR